MTTPDLPAPLARSVRGRILGGVCAGLARRWSVPVVRARAAFALATAVFGLGALVYVACWLILPAEGEDGAAPGPRGVVLLAQLCGALVGLAVLGVAGSVATVFGFGWVVVALGGALLAGVLAGWPRVGPGWALLPVGALALPSLALAAGGLRIDPQTESRVLAPRTIAALPARLHSGLGQLEVDLRHTAWPGRGTVSLRVDAGLRRTLVALPHDRCVHVEVRQHLLPFASRAAAIALGAGTPAVPGARVFGEPMSTTTSGSPGRRPGPTLRIDFSSAGGQLVVRDYPDRIDPAAEPDWPGYPVEAGPRPSTSGMSRPTARRVLRSWREERAYQTRIQRLLPGPCARPAKGRGHGSGRSRRAAHHHGGRKGRTR